MEKLPRSLLLVAVLLLGLTFIMPLWSISLQAPQYPEGIGLYIKLNTITGHHFNDLNNINLVNHYIGMQTIEPGSIPELKYMPFLVGFLILTGLLAVWLKKPRWVLVWLILFSLLAVAGLIDFYLWNYDFGHNLHTETAAIKIEGMTYQPPILGTKVMLNFTTTSLPHGGGVAAFLSLALGIIAYVLMIRRKENQNAAGS